MNTKSILFYGLLLFSSISFSQDLSKNLFGCENVTAFKKSRTPDIGIIISSGDPETVWNAIRLGVYSQGKGDTVVIFVLGKALDIYMNDTSKFKVHEMSLEFMMNGGDIYACATCAKQRNTENIEYCTITSVADLYEIVKRSKKVLTF